MIENINKLLSTVLILFISLVFIISLATCNPVSDYCFSKKNITSNYHTNKKYFTILLDYIFRNNLGPFNDVEFLEDNALSCILQNDLSRSVSDGTVYIGQYDISNFKIINVELSVNNDIVIYTPDTVVTYNNWVWKFEGTRNSIGYASVLKHLNLNYEQVDSLRILTSRVNCKSIEINENKDIFIRYCGVKMCQIVYVYSAPTDYSNFGFILLDKNFYFGLYRDSLVTGDCLLKNDM